MPSRTSMFECCGVNDPCLTRGGVKVCPVCEKAPSTDLDQRVDKARDLLRRTLRATEGPFNERLEALESAIARQAQQPLLDLLRELEWVNDTGCGGHCPVCSRYDHVGHTPDCRLGNLLKER